MHSLYVTGFMHLEYVVSLDVDSGPKDKAQLSNILSIFVFICRALTVDARCKAIQQTWKQLQETTVKDQ